MLQGKLAEAEPLLVAALEGRRKVLGEQNPDTLESMDSVASLYWRQGKCDEAEPIRATLLELQRRVLGEEHPQTLTSMNNLALLSMYSRQVCTSRDAIPRRHREDAARPRRPASRR